MPGTLHIGHAAAPAETAGGADHAWCQVDPAGHFHAYDLDGGLPTLIAHEVVSPAGRVAVVYLCRACGDELTPRRAVAEAGRLPVLSWRVDVAQDVMVAGHPSVQASTGSALYFGFALPVARELSPDTGGLSITTRFVGVGPLGQRRHA